MLTHNQLQRRGLQQLSREELVRLQCEKLNGLLSRVLPDNGFYRRKLGDVRAPLSSITDLQQFPFTLKEELLGGVDGAEIQASHQEDLAANLTFDVSEYVRFHRTSGTRGRPMVVLDTAEDWQWWIDAWQFVLDAADVTEIDRALMAFSFGPFIGFWSAHDALIARGAMTLPAGGMSTQARMDLVRNARATLVLCTPTYALRMAQEAATVGLDLRSLEVRAIIVAGEPGGSIPAVRERIEDAWNAQVIDHSGATEIGPWGFADPKGNGLFVNESEFIAEFLSLETGAAAGAGELSELVLTTLGRAGAPVIRYRTGDMVRPTWNSRENGFVFLPGGVLGRTDDMMIVRGVNVFPSSIEQILRGFPEIVEYRITAERVGEMDALTVEIEDRLNHPQRVAAELQLRLGLSVKVDCVPLESLPRFEAKGNRFIDQRK